MLNNAWYDMVETAKDRLEDSVRVFYTAGESIDFGDIYEEIFQSGFNADYEYIYTNECREVCNNLDVWDCISLVRNYEISEFGYCATEINDPLKVANMVWYDVGYMTYIEIPYKKVYTREELIEAIKDIDINQVIHMLDFYINKY